MVPKSRDWRLVYEWRNYRLSCLRMNRKKREFTDVLDPFCIDDDWFVMDVVEFRVHPGPSLAHPGSRALRLPSTAWV